MSRVNQYRLYCTSENCYAFVWSDQPPNACPSNSQHTIDKNTITIVNTVDTNSVENVQERNPTGGNYRSESKKVIAGPNATTSFDFVWPYKISVLTMTLYTSSNSKNDIVNTFVAPNTTIGANTAAISSGNNIIAVSNTVLQYLKIGFQVSVTNGTQPSWVGECISINAANSTITLDTPAPSNIPAGQYIQMSINNVKNFVLRNDTVYELARKTIGASSIPSSTTLRLQYQNLSTTESKELFFSYEYYY
jgi:hypothetical protein